VTDHKGINDFYRFYKQYLMNVTPKLELNGMHERVVFIIEGILTDAGYEEAAVNILNDGYIDELPSWLAVEVPAIVDKNGVHGIKMGRLPSGFLGLLRNQVAVHDLTADAILQKSRHLALQALLVDPIVCQYQHLEEMLDTIIDYQQPFLDYLQ
ncbi:MAG: alpha-glucosidase, partial [Anaerolineales bacterium]|nr:alpha-glucosidase [Anaerolineales bacterium]